MSSSDDFTASDAIEDGTEGVDERGVSGFAQAGVIGAALSALGFAIADFILSIQSTLFAPIRAFTDGIATFIGGTLGAPVIITDAGAETAAGSLASGTASLLGPFAFPVAVVVSISGVWVLIWFVRNQSINPIAVFRDEEN